MAHIVEQVGAALTAAHAAGIIHRDLKPANIMYDPATQTAKLLDFGIARDAELPQEERLTRAGFFVGTLQYVAPEALSGELVGEQADVYSLATIAYYLLTGELPFPGKSPRELFQQLLTLDAAGRSTRWPRASKFSPALEAALMAGLERDLTKRPATIQEFCRRFVRRGPGRAGKEEGLPLRSLRQGLTGGRARGARSSSCTTARFGTAISRSPPAPAPPTTSTPGRPRCRPRGCT